MRKDYPTFRDQKLSSLVEQVRTLDSVIDEEQKILNSLRTSSNFTDEELRNRTYEWLVHYELKVRFEEPKQFESWKRGLDVIGWKYHRGEYVETEEEARQRIKDAKGEIASSLGQKVRIDDYGKEMEGTVIDYNINWAQITKGRFTGPDGGNIIFKEKKPDHQADG
ncbi:MAG: hypothetical protein KKC19_02660 [Nanoarchaeota archaeon]|nr:hypothetical protein [Nanoarchaeota archaeon]